MKAKCDKDCRMFSHGIIILGLELMKHDCDADETSKKKNLERLFIRASRTYYKIITCEEPNDVMQFS